MIMIYEIQHHRQWALNAESVPHSPAQTSFCIHLHVANILKRLTAETGASTFKSTGSTLSPGNLGVRDTGEFCSTLFSSLINT